MTSDQYQWLCNRLSEIIRRLPAKEQAEGPSDAAACSRLADCLESPPPYRKHVSKEKLWLVLDVHGDSVLWSDQELAVDAAVEALNYMAGIVTER